MMARHLRTTALVVLMIALLTLLSTSFIIAPDTTDAPQVVNSTPIVSRANLNVTDYEVEYALITSEALAASYQPLIDWKIQKGLRAKMYLIDGANGIYTNYINGDNARRVHDFLVALNSNSANLKWVLLGGDSEVIPSRHMWAGARARYGSYEWEDYYYSDYYYAGLESSWDTDGDGIYGEPGEEDVSPEVYVGRLPSKNAAETKIMVDRVVGYESNITDGEWLSRGFFSASLMDAPNIPDDPDTNATDEGYNDYKDNAYEGMQGSLAYVPNYMTKTVLYDYPQITGGNYNTTNDTLNAAAFKAEMNKGYGMVNFLGQAVYGANELVHYDDPTGIAQGYGLGFKPLYSYSDARAISNGNKASFVVMATCDSGNFTEEDDTDMETLLKATNGGVIGLIASSGRSYRGEHEDDTSFGNWWFNKFLMMNFYNGDTVQGQLLYDLKEEYYNKIYPDCYMPECVIGNVYGYNLLGDPETDIYNNRVSTFSVTPGSVYKGANSVTITVTKQGGATVEGAKVSLYGLGVLASGLTDSDGKAILDLTTPSTGAMEITVTAHNFKAYMSSVSVIERPLDLEVTDSSLTIEPKDGIPGQDIYVNVTVSNVADLAMSSVTARLLDGTATLKDFTFDIAAQGIYNISHIFNSDTPGDHDLVFKVDPDNAIAESNENNNQVSMTLHLDHAPVMGELPPLLLQEDDAEINILSLKDYATDPDNDNYTLTYSLLDNENLSCFVSVTTAGDVSVVPEPNWNGQTKALVSVSDGQLTDSQYLLVTVDPADDLPIITDVESQTAYTDQKFNMRVTATDPDKGDVITYSDDSPLFDIDASTGMISFIPYTVNEGTTTVTITATDSKGNTDTASFTLLIQPNDQPYIEQQTFELTKGKEFKTTITVENAGGHTYTFSDNSALFDIDPATGEIKFTPKKDDIGKHTVKLTATDNQDQSKVVGTITLDVKDKTEDPSSTAPLIILILIVLIALGIVVFYFFVRPNLKKEEEEEEDEPEKRGKRVRPSKLGKGDDDDDDRDDKKKRERPKLRRPKKDEEEDEEGSKGILSGLLKKSDDDDGEEDKPKGRRMGKKDDPPVVKPRRVKAPVGAGRKKKDDDQEEEL